jgi:hypothetical protein
MIPIICVDNSNGMLFNHRRCSSDKELIRHLRKVTENAEIWCNQYSLELFDYPVKCDEDFLNKASPNDYCFVEDNDLSDVNFDEIVICYWNRDYPSDLFFSKASLVESWKIITSINLKGSSHDKITILRRRK